jgi:hypothetical protein
MYNDTGPETMGKMNKNNGSARNVPRMGITNRKATGINGFRHLG